MAADPQDPPRHAGQVVRRALPATTPTPARPRHRLRAAVLTLHRLSGSFGAGDTSVNGTNSASSAGLKAPLAELTALATRQGGRRRV
jgi:hypothetical protein